MTELHSNSLETWKLWNLVKVEQQQIVTVLKYVHYWLNQKVMSFYGA